MKIRKIIIALLVFIATSSLLFAQGASEKSENEKLIQVVSLDKTEDGYYDITGLLEDGKTIIYHVAPDAEIDFPIENIYAGMYLYVKDNGIMTMSIPPQSPAVAIRDVTMAVKGGIIDTVFAPKKVELKISETNLDDLFSKFSYAYGYLTSKNYMLNGVYFNAGYYAKGMFDAWAYGDIEPFFTMEEMYSYVEQFVSQYQNESSMPKEIGDVYTTEEEISSLTEPTSLSEQFSYSYGYLTTLDLLYQGYDIVVPDFASGSLYALYEIDPIMSDEQMDGALDEYNSYLSNLYSEYLEELKSANLEEANKLLEENGKKDGVATLPSGVQIEITSQDAEPGAIPEKDDSVVVDYKLSLPDGTVVDENQDITFDLDSLIPGFVDAVTNMHVGDTATVYIPPELGYGENGAGDIIGPNQLLIYTIYLKSIVEE